MTRHVTRARAVLGLVACALICCGPLAGCGSAQRTDVAYVDGGTPAQRLDLYLPRGSGPHPLVIYVHGGAWKFGDKALPADGGRSGPGALRKTLNDNGYAVASVQYRFIQDAAFPAALYDVRAAARYLRAHAGELGLDPGRFAVAGDSAGGHLALMLAMTDGIAELDGGLGSAGAPAKVRAAISYNGVHDLTTLGSEQLPPDCAGKPSPGDLAVSLLGPGHSEDRSRAAFFSPAGHLDRAVPTLLFHGDADCIVPVGQSIQLDDALRRHGVSSRLVVVQGAKHSDPTFYRDSGRQRVLLDFLSETLR